MNNYPRWWDTTVTIYNKYTDPTTRIVRWYSTVVSDTFWKNANNKVVVGNTTIETDNIICRLRKDSRFLEKHEWLQVPNDRMSNYFTLSEGDIIIKGEVEDVINEYEEGKRSNDILKKYKKLQGCMTIENVSINVGNRGNEHYYVKGV